jgi:hypothetical protein
MTDIPRGTSIFREIPLDEMYVTMGMKILTIHRVPRRCGH